MLENNNTPPFTQLLDLAAERLGGQTLVCSDDFFAEMQNMLKPDRGIFIADKYTDNGKWMDGWESRRKRTEGHDWCVVRLGTCGVIRGVDIDTNYFLGNYPPFASIEACFLPEGDPSVNFDNWTEILPKSPLQGGSQNFYAIEHQEKWSHIRLHIYPDGGVARLKVYGEVQKDWSLVPKETILDLAAATNGGKAIVCNDAFFSHKDNINMPNRGENMGDGWETKRNRTPNNSDWLILRLAQKGTIHKIVVDTCHFKGNYPDRCKIEGCTISLENEADLSANTGNIAWKTILPESKLQADFEHVYEKELLLHEPFTHIRLTIFPDGGVSRLRLFGSIEKDVLTLRELNQADPSVFQSVLMRCCGSTTWVEKMWSLRPFENRADVYQKAEQAWFSCKKSDWLAAFTQHPRIGDVASLRQKFASTATWASGEQSGATEASEHTLQELKRLNDVYFERFGFIFIVFATGKTAEEMLSILQNRVDNDVVEEIINAVMEQHKITKVRLEKLLL